MIPIRPRDRVRIDTLLLAVLDNDTPAVGAVLDDPALVTDPLAVAHLVLGLADGLASFIAEYVPDHHEQLRDRIAVNLLEPDLG